MWCHDTTVAALKHSILMKLFPSRTVLLASAAKIGLSNNDLQLATKECSRELTRHYTGHGSRKWRSLY